MNENYFSLALRPHVMKLYILTYKEYWTDPRRTKISLKMLRDNIAPKKGNMLKHDILLIIFKCCVCKITLIAILPNSKLMYNQINDINK